MFTNQRYAICAVLTLLLTAGFALAGGKAKSPDPRSRIEGPMPPPIESNHSPQPGSVILSNVPADYDWWNGCSPTAAGMLFGWWEEAGQDSFPGSHRDLPAAYPDTSANPADYTDARGVVAGWAHKQAGMAQGLQYGSYENHAPDSLADFMLTYEGGTSRCDMPHGFETFAAWDDPRTTQIESRRMSTSTVYVDYGWSYADYCAQIDANKPVHLGLASDLGGHSVLGVGYNNTAGQQDVILLTTWHWGLQQWQWADETYSGYGLSVYGGTPMDSEAGATPELSAYFSLAHTWIGDLSVEIGVGDPNDPEWSAAVWSREGSYSENLVLTDIDVSAMLADFLSGELQWYLKVTDDAGLDTGSILDFQIRNGFDEAVFAYDGEPVPIFDYSTSVVYLHTVPEPATIAILAVGALAILRRVSK